MLGTTDELVRILRENRPDEVLIAMPSAPGEVRRKIVDVTRAEGIPVKTLPGLHELIAGDLEPRRRRSGRCRSRTCSAASRSRSTSSEIAAYVRDRTVLVTGAGGSIGSELCRQLARLGAARLVLVEQGESALYEIERELVDERGFTAAIPVLADCGDAAEDAARLRALPAGGRLPRRGVQARADAGGEPAAGGRRTTCSRRASIAEVAVEFGVERFVLISTDKAAKPKNLLGQSKAVCEWIVESFAARDDVDTRFVAVRFGNVLGSSGSVIPIFRRQIERGGPVTVTHPEMTRFFMTIPEAVVARRPGRRDGRQRPGLRPRHGQPVKIVDLARQMIELSGRTEEQIPIAFVGARAGEKLHEELWNDGEDVGPTTHPKIMRAAPRPDRPRVARGRAGRARAPRRRGRHARRGRRSSATMMREQQRTGAAMLEDTLH